MVKEGIHSGQGQHRHQQDDAFDDLAEEQIDGAGDEQEPEHRIGCRFSDPLRKRPEVTLDDDVCAVLGTLFGDRGRAQTERAERRETEP
jgi:hypothetical protein